ncbi:hypothetical protein GMORB2_6861 [Geosmithia morbida]|uniref:Uncharacterized protein n=1 Tax=Geosmithia morbida TaxID=1094350 RepID=A0A9P4YME8_9HYPO|nr:uncharacterized protein GMORB2_5475 [Geosmithia morbida]XP_035321207.1 uncharacterized protein GMORB2_6861 [Geosmithia morbida]KAF4119250.1 hypothetical protein GMORB2_5475 [Geosmithia morbida]KAF4122555.1 hypothetical protein GMORB2_6861 [Geosmithia morbida]
MEPCYEDEDLLLIPLSTPAPAAPAAPAAAAAAAAAGGAPVSSSGASASALVADLVTDGTAAPAAMDTRHMARFEFSDVGTKILMVEWLPESADPTATTTTAQDATATTTTAVPPSTTATCTSVSGGGQGDTAGSGSSAPAPAPASVNSGAWEVSWPGKSVTLPARDTTDDDDKAHTTNRRRVFFLLPQDAPVPATVIITPPNGDGPAIRVKPLPAIFPEGFGARGTARGSRGVLHTIWAKKRLRELEREIDAEVRANTESVAVEMALAEKQWIVDTFLSPPTPPAPAPGPLKISTNTAGAGVGAGGGGGDAPPTPRSPVSSGRLGDKLKGLRLATSPADLASSPANTFTTAGSQSDTLSPMGDDIAMPSTRAAMARPVGAPMSLDAALQGGVPAAGPTPADDEESDLFALPISPRSPDMKKSPFSIF